ncbi:MAG: hypothetical protein JO112_09560, partial [Planctomycetes bacterium]|nr:hypothetical protein [Planctomycetota bacterium]
MPCTATGKEYQALAGRFDLAGLVAAHLWWLDAPLAASVLGCGLLGASGASFRARRCDLLAFVDFPQLQELAIQFPPAAPPVAELIFAAALREPASSGLAYLEPLIDLPTLAPACASVYRVSLEEWRSGSFLNPGFLLEPQGARAGATARRTEPSRQRLLDLIRQKPSMTRNYYRLRLLARNHFLAPLGDAIETNNPDRAWRVWKSQGQVDDMVEECVRLSGRRQELDRSHYEQTRRYLDHFQSELRQWCELGRQRPRDRNGPLRLALEALHREATAGRNSICNSLWETIRCLQENPQDPSLPHRDFGQRLARAEGEPLLLDPQEMVGPLATWSWPAARTKGAVPLSLVLGDRLRQALGTAPASLDEAIEEYWNGGEFLVARESAEEHPIWQRTIAERLEKKKEDLRAAQATLLQEAESYRAYEEYIDAWLLDINRTLEDLRFDTVPGLFKELETLVLQARLRRDPVRLGLLEFLREAGQHPGEDTSCEELEHQAEEVRGDQELRRLHLIELKRACEDLVLPAALRERWSRLARDLDRPTRWPADETSFHLAYAIPQFVAFLKGHLQDQEGDTAMTTLFVERFTEWLPEQFRADPAFAGPAGARALEQIKKLAEDIVNHRSERRILQRLGSPPPSLAAPTPSVSLVGSAPSVETAAPVVRAVLTPPLARDPHQEAAEVLEEVRAFLAEQLGREMLPADSDSTRLRAAVRGQRWETARGLAAALVRQAPAPKGAGVTDLEAVYAISLACGPQAVADPMVLRTAFQKACLAALATERSAYNYYVPANLLMEYVLAARGVLLAMGQSVPDQAVGATLGEPLAEVLQQLLDAPPGHPAYEWIRDLFWKASRLEDEACARLADAFWEGLRETSNEESRFYLLRLLFRMRRREALKHLTRHIDQVDDLVRICLHAFEQAEEDSSVRPQARELLITLREQSYRRRNSRPWIHLFQHLEANRGEILDFPVQFELQSDALAREAEGGPAVVQVLLKPSLADPPRSLELQFLGDPALTEAALPPVLIVPEEEMLLRPKSMEVIVPKEALVMAGDVIDVRYHLRGTTVLRKPISSQDHWTFPNRYRNLMTLSPEEIDLAWPGARGEPVGGEGFHGRQEEKARIDGCLRARDRMHSLMV